MDEFRQLFGDSDDELEFLGFEGANVEQNNRNNEEDSSDESSEDDKMEMDADGNILWSQVPTNVPTPGFLKDFHGPTVNPRDRSFKGYFRLMFTNEMV